MFVPLIAQVLLEGEGWSNKPWVNRTAWMTVVASTDRPKLTLNRCVIEYFSVFMLL